MLRRRRNARASTSTPTPIPGDVDAYARPDADRRPRPSLRRASCATWTRSAASRSASVTLSWDVAGADTVAASPTRAASGWAQGSKATIAVADHDLCADPAGARPSEVALTVDSGDLRPRPRLTSPAAQAPPRPSPTETWTFGAAAYGNGRSTLPPTDTAADRAATSRYAAARRAFYTAGSGSRNGRRHGHGARTCSRSTTPVAPATAFVLLDQRTVCRLARWGEMRRQAMISWAAGHGQRRCVGIRRRCSSAAYKPRSGRCGGGDGQRPERHHPALTAHRRLHSSIRFGLPRRGRRLQHGAPAGRAADGELAGYGCASPCCWVQGQALVTPVVALSASSAMNVCASSSAIPDPGL